MHALKALEGSGDMAQFFLYLCSRWGSGISLTPWPLYHWGNGLQEPANVKVGRLQSHSGRYGEKYLAPDRIWTSDCSPHSLVTILPVLSWLCVYIFHCSVISYTVVNQDSTSTSVQFVAWLWTLYARWFCTSEGLLVAHSGSCKCIIIMCNVCTFRPSHISF